MKKITCLITIISTFILLLSCGEDRTREYEQLTQHNIWMFDVMSDRYLFADKFSEQTWKDYFASPSNYFAKLTAKGTDDQASYIIVDTVSTDPHSRGHFNHIESYGFDYTLMTDPTGATTRSYARVITVYDNSPASRAGLKRNDYIETIGGIRISTANQSKLEQGSTATLGLKRLTINTETQAYKWQDGGSITLEPSEYVDDKPFPVYTTIRSENSMIGYLMCNRLIATSGDGRSTTDYSQQLDQIMRQFSTANINHFVLDLRLCNFGTFDMARRLASYILPPYMLDTYFARTYYNSNYESLNDSITFDTSLAGQTLDLDYVYVIVSSYTKGAAEWVVNGLRQALGTDNVIIIGTTTAGDNMLTEHIGDYESIIHLYPAVAYVADATGDYTTYASGITPTISVDEFQYLELYDYGDIYEVLLRTALQHIVNGETTE